MAAAAVRAVMLAAVLTLAVPLTGVAATEPPHDDPLAATEAGESPKEGDAAADDSGDDAAPSQQLFSTLGALSLGVLGLLWMRRRAASL